MMIQIDIFQQRLTLQQGDTLIHYPVSTAKNGPGERLNSHQTPRGKHCVIEKIGDQLPLYSVFQARKPTGEIFSPALAHAFPERDWILTRILRLQGLEPGLNQGGEVDTYSRYIYIHGTADEAQIGTPVSHGCIRMKNADIKDLFDRISVNILVEIF